MPKVLGVNASPFVRKVRVALAEKNVAYELEPVLPFNQTAEFKKLSPLGKIPVYQDGDVTLPDSSIIIAYLERTHPTPALYPSNPYDFGRALWFEEYGDSALVSVCGPKIFLEKVVAPLFFNRPTNQETVDKAINEELPPMFDYLESQLKDGAGTLVGDTFTVGDIGIATHFVNLRHAGVGVDAKRWPKLAKYIEKVHARPSFKALIDEETPQYNAAA